MGKCVDLARVVDSELTNFTPCESIEYAEHMLTELGKIVHRENREMLFYFLEMARLEAHNIRVNEAKHMADHLSGGF